MAYFLTGREPPKTTKIQNTKAIEYVTDIIYEREESPDEIQSIEHLLLVMYTDYRREDVFKDCKEPWTLIVRYAFKILLKGDVIAKE